MLGLDLVDGLHCTLMRQYFLDDSDARDDGFVGFQAFSQPKAKQQQCNDEQAQPEQRTPLTPRKRIVLHVFRREKFVGMQRIDVHRDDFQRKLFAFEGFSIDFHLDGRQRIDVFVETRDG